MAGRLAPYIGVLGVGATGVLLAYPELLSPRHVEEPYGPVPSRAEQIASLKAGTKDNPFDLLIIGGGATGTGCALDATSRCAGGMQGKAQCRMGRLQGVVGPCMSL